MTHIGSTIGDLGYTVSAGSTAEREAGSTTCEKMIRSALILENNRGCNYPTGIGEY